MITTPPRPLPAPKVDLGDAGGVGVVDHRDVTAERLGEELRGVGPDPRRVDVRRAVGDAALDDGGERGSGGAGPLEEAGDLGDHAGDRVGGRRMGGEDAVAVGEQLTAAGVDGCTLDAGPADVDAEHCRHGVIIAQERPDPASWPAASGRLTAMDDASSST